MLYDTSKENTEYEQSAFISFYQQILLFPLLIARLLLLSLSARTTVGPLSNQILMYYPKRDTTDTAAKETVPPTSSKGNFQLKN